MWVVGPELSKSKDKNPIVWMACRGQYLFDNKAEWIVFDHKAWKRAPVFVTCLGKKGMCSAPLIPTHGQMVEFGGVTPKSRVVFMCFAGFAMFGSTVRVCQSGVWNGASAFVRLICLIACLVAIIIHLLSGTNTTTT